MDLNSQVVNPVVEPTGVSAVVAYVAGGIAGTCLLYTSDAADE